MSRLKCSYKVNISCMKCALQTKNLFNYHVYCYHDSKRYYQYHDSWLTIATVNNYHTIIQPQCMYVCIHACVYIRMCVCTYVRITNAKFAVSLNCQCYMVMWRAICYTDCVIIQLLSARFICNDFQLKCFHWLMLAGCYFLLISLFYSYLQLWKMLLTYVVADFLDEWLV